MNCVSYMIPHKIKDISRVKQISQKNQNPIISIKIVNLWKAILIIPVYRYSLLV